MSRHDWNGIPVIVECNREGKRLVIFLNDGIMIIGKTADEYFCRLSFMCVNYFCAGKKFTDIRQIEQIISEDLCLSVLSQRCNICIAERLIFENILDIIIILR